MKHPSAGWRTQGNDYLSRLIKHNPLYSWMFHETIKNNLKNKLMKKIIFALIITASFIYACDKEEGNSERFNSLTGITWTSDSLLADGQDASGPGGLLENFKGEARFYEDGTGYFGNYDGTWAFNNTETQLIINSPDLLAALTVNIEELTSTSFKVTTQFPSQTNPGTYINIRMTFVPK